MDCAKTKSDKVTQTILTKNQTNTCLRDAWYIISGDTLQQLLSEEETADSIIVEKQPIAQILGHIHNNTDSTSLSGGPWVVQDRDVLKQDLHTEKYEDTIILGCRWTTTRE